MGGAIFAQFFLLTLYMQEVLHYSAIKTGVAYIGLTLTIIVFSASPRRSSTGSASAGCCRSGSRCRRSRSCCSRGCRCTAHYFGDLFPAFIISGLGLALAFVPMSIGAPDGRRAADAGIASGLINTTQQIGGAIGVAVAITIATTFTSRYVDCARRDDRLSGAALTHGFQMAFCPPEQRICQTAASRSLTNTTAVGRSHDDHRRQEARRSNEENPRCP